MNYFCHKINFEKSLKFVMQCNIDFWYEGQKITFKNMLIE